MKKLSCVLAVASFMFACNNANETSTTDTTSVTTVTVDTVDAAPMDTSSAAKPDSTIRK